jgi:hypothetical protein
MSSIRISLLLPKLRVISCSPAPLPFLLDGLAGQRWWERGGRASPVYYSSSRSRGWSSCQFGVMSLRWIHLKPVSCSRRGVVEVWWLGELLGAEAVICDTSPSTSSIKLDRGARDPFNLQAPLLRPFGR